MRLRACTRGCCQLWGSEILTYPALHPDPHRPHRPASRDPPPQHRARDHSPRSSGGWVAEPAQAEAKLEFPGEKPRGRKDRPSNQKPRALTVGDYGELKPPPSRPVPFQIRSVVPLRLSKSLNLLSSVSSMLHNQPRSSGRSGENRSALTRMLLKGRQQNCHPELPNRWA